MAASLPAAGRTLFRWRSYTPVPLAALAILWLWLGPGLPMAPPALAWLRFAAGLALCAAGQALRVYLMATVKDGTSGQGYELVALALNTHGPYRFTRNPLYVGNFLILLGVGCFAGDWVVLALGVAFFFAQYTAIISAEEEFLRGRFGAVYEAFTERVPRFWPRLTPAEPPEGGAPAAAFDWRRALKKEHNPAFAWLTAALALWALPARRDLAPAALAWAALAVAYVLVKLWKKGKILA